MSKRNDCKNLLKLMLEEKLDSSLFEYGFNRRSNSVKYTRVIGETKQIIDMVMYVSPSYSREDDAHLYPMLEIRIPSINKIARQLAGDDLLLANTPDITLRQVIELTAPKEDRNLWFASGRGEFMKTGDLIREFMEKWLLPFLDQYSSPEGIVEGYKDKDPRPMNQEMWYLYIAAAYLALGKRESALKVLEDRFKTVGAKRRFQNAFNFLRQLQ